MAHRAALSVLPLVATLRRNDPRHGLLQELSDIVFAKHSAFSYEDLTSDKMGAIFGAARNSPSARNFSTEPMYSNNDKDASK